jgi:general stress protein 26
MKENNFSTREACIDKLRDLIQDIRVAMFTSAAEDGSLHSRPMVTQEVEFDGDLWFFNRIDSGKTAELAKNAQVNVSYMKPGEQCYVSVSGVAETSRDREKMKALWRPALKAWFPDGLDDPTLSLIRVRVTKAEYWDTPSSKLVHLIGFAKAVATGKTYEPGDHAKVSLG